MSQLPQIEARIRAIANDLATGQSREVLLATYGEQWRISSRTMDRYIKEAKKISTSIRENADKIIQEQTVQVIADAAINGLRSALDVDLRVQEIIFNNHKLVRLPDMTDNDGKIIQKGKVIKVDNSAADVLKAAQLYYRRMNLLGKEDLTKRKIKITINGKSKPQQNGPAGT